MITKLRFVLIILLIASLKNTFGQAPTISYSTPNNYPVGFVIPPLSPTVSSRVGGAGSNNITAVGSGFNNSTGVAVDSAGNVYVADNGNNAIIEIPANGGAEITLGSGFVNPTGVAADRAGNVYVVDNGHNAIKKIPAGNGAIITIGAGFSGPYGIAVDAAGNLYVGDASNNQVKKIPAGSNTPIVIGSGFNHPTGVAVDALGNVYVADRANNAIKEILAGTNSTVFLASGSGNPNGVAVDASGNVYFADTNDGAVEEVQAGSNNVSRITGNGFNTLTGVATGVVDPNIIYVDSYGNGTIYKITPTGGYFISPGLPAGLSFLSGFGQVVGTPTVISSPANYTVRAYNEVGSGSAIVNISVYNTNAGLANLALSKGALSPSFATAVTTYTSNETNNTTSITIIPVASQSSSTITVDGVPVVSGTASQPVALNVGTNTISVIVRSSGGQIIGNYTITVTRAPSNNAYLSNLTVKTATLSPAFNFKTFAYTASVPNTTTSVTVKPALFDATASSLKVNGMIVPNKTASAPIPLTVGSNTINVTVIAQDGITTQTYTITVSRAPSAIATLSNLQISSGTLTPVFASGTTSYTATVVTTTAFITVTPTTTDATAKITVNGKPVTSNTASGAINLAMGANTITTVVTAQDGVTTDAYTLTVTRDASGTNDAYLAYLSVTTATLSPAFAFKTLAYTSSVPNSTSSVTVTPSLLDASASSLTVNGISVANKTASGPIALAVGSNTIDIVIIAQDGVTTQTYTVTVTRTPAPLDGFGPQISVNNPAEHPSLNDDIIVVHNGISPNGDGINDFLVIDGILAYPDNKLSIMNRNGQLIYEASGYDNGSKVFDGHSNKNGQMQLPGTYFYQLDYTANGTTKHKTGFIVLKY